MFISTLIPPTRVVKDCYAKNMRGMCWYEYSFIKHINIYCFCIVIGQSTNYNETSKEKFCRITIWLKFPKFQTISFKRILMKNFKEENDNSLPHRKYFSNLSKIESSDEKLGWITNVWTLSAIRSLNDILLYISWINKSIHNQSYYPVDGL